MHKRCLISLILIITMAVSTAIAFGATTTTSKYTGSKFTHNSRFDNMLIVDGVDVSAWQENVDWAKAKADGIDFAIIRIAGRGYGAAGNMYKDGQYAKHIKGAKEAGLMVGVYYFSQAITEKEAIEEANETLKYLAGEELDMPVFMDYEFAGANDGGRLVNAKLSKAQMTKNAVAFCETIKAAGYDAGFYSNLLFLRNTVDGKSLGNKYSMWAAQYYGHCEYEHPYSIWQYSSSGKINGISGRADCNFWYLENTPKATTTNSIANCEVSFTTASTYLYNSGKPIEPEVIVEKNGVKLKKGTDYAVGYIKNTAIGTGYVMVQGKGKYSDYKLIPFTISNKLPEDIKVDTDKMIQSSKYTFKDYVRGVKLKTSINDFKSGLTMKEGYTYKVLNANDMEVISGNVGTGFKLCVYDSNNTVVANQTIVVKGDCSGDGECKAIDLLRLKKYTVGRQSFNPPYLDSIDINNDGRVGAIDLLYVNKYLLGKYEIKG